MLNDSAMNLALWNVSKYSTRCYAIDSVSVTNEKMFIPEYPLASCSYVLVPVHMGALKHWVIQNCGDTTERCRPRQAQDLGHLLRPFGCKREHSCLSS
ncbi:hypothetical protein JG688_00016313 [Phytophthora aleatoria]|uniref:Uncharacterized protein n=1 Tax=Phytophthora aleatoria TaxID=2496075 RepID=A0A8J5IJ20_9STRA|nr:hypothetical protein JG688_00016313 [Phytophthora aleatoria]